VGIKINRTVQKRAIFPSPLGRDMNPFPPSIFKFIKLPMNHDDNKTIKIDNTRIFFSFRSINVIYLHDRYFTFPLHFGIFQQIQKSRSVSLAF